MTRQDTNRFYSYPLIRTGVLCAGTVRQPLDHLVEHNLWWHCWWRVFPHDQASNIKQLLRRGAR